jgi:hypothetical protein
LLAACCKLVFGHLFVLLSQPFPSMLNALVLR